MPYKVIEVDGAEADDIIGTLTRETQEFGKHEPIKIISSDKDFIQLHRFKNVSQFSPMQKKEVSDPDPVSYIFDHIMRGDSGDGVPNVKSPDDVLVKEDGRQTPIRKDFIAECKENESVLSEFMDTEIFRNYQRNKKLIDLTEIPESIYNSIMEKYNGTKPAMQMRILNYFIAKRCNRLIECIEEFHCAKK